MKYIIVLSALILNLFLLSGFSMAEEERFILKNPKIKKNQVALDVRGRLIHSLSYARRVGDTSLSFGGGLGFGWELNRHTFERNIWEASHIEIFARFQPFQGLQLDFGPTLMGYIWQTIAPNVQEHLWGFTFRLLSATNLYLAALGFESVLPMTVDTALNLGQSWVYRPD